MVSKTSFPADSTKPVELTCSVQNYEWGIIGGDSLVGKIYEKNSGKVVEEGKPYAEVKVILFLIITNSSFI